MFILQMYYRDAVFCGMVIVESSFITVPTKNNFHSKNGDYDTVVVWEISTGNGRLFVVLLCCSQDKKSEINFTQNNAFHAHAFLVRVHRIKALTPFKHKYTH